MQSKFCKPNYNITKLKLAKITKKEIHPSITLDQKLFENCCRGNDFASIKILVQICL